MRNFLTILTGCIFLLASMGPALAGPELFPSTRSHTHDQFSRSSGVAAGAYMRVPFNGGLSRASEEPRFGLRLTGNLAGQYRYQSPFVGSGAPRMLDLSLGTSGVQSFRFNGMSVEQINALYAKGDDGGSGIGRGVVYGLAVLGAVILVAIAVDQS